jgi:hypothetical protein
VRITAGPKPTWFVMTWIYLEKPGVGISRANENLTLHGIKSFATTEAEHLWLGFGSCKRL